MTTIWEKNQQALKKTHLINSYKKLLLICFSFCSFDYDLKKKLVRQEPKQLKFVENKQKII